MDRATIIERHDFYVDQVRRRVLSQFENIEAEAEQFMEDEYARLGASAGPPIDLSDLADIARERGYDHYALLADLKKQMLLGALAGCYHQWDKELRDFIEHELLHHYRSEDVEKFVWGPDSRTVFQALEEFGWGVTSLSFYADLDAARLVVNVYKHGKGRSAIELCDRYPQYIPNPLGTKRVFSSTLLDHDWLEISEGQFVVLAAAMRAFWVGFPERLFLP